MVRSFFRWFGYIPERDGVSPQRLTSLEDENLRLRAEIEALRGVDLPFVSVDAKEPAPHDRDERKLYVARVAAFHHEIMKPKILSMIADVRSQLGKLDSTFDNQGRKITHYSPQDFDLILKGTENALWLMHDWGESMMSEQLENQRELSSEEHEDLRSKVITT